MSRATFRAGRYMNPRGDWIAAVYVHIVDEGSWQWSKPCETRWGAGRLAKRQARKLSRAYDRGELRL